MVDSVAILAQARSATKSATKFVTFGRRLAAASAEWQQSVVFANTTAFPIQPGSKTICASHWRSWKPKKLAGTAETCSSALDRHGMLVRITNGLRLGSTWISKVRLWPNICSFVQFNLKLLRASWLRILKSLWLQPKMNSSLTRGKH